ncbi:Alanine--glyoxylate aminotransferase 2 [Blattella germanica]|nr:Alanine--glyoxylate aminotransferase 2 [Blattella germanica]
MCTKLTPLNFILGNTKKCTSWLQIWMKNGRAFSQAAGEMPKFDYEPNQYGGLPYDKIKRIRESHLIPCFNPYYKEPLLINEGKMQWLFDYKGKRYLDLFGGIVTISVGHCHPKVTEAATEQMKKLWHTTNIYFNSKTFEYAEKLASKFPGDLKVVYFVNSGSEANDLAVLLARLYTKNFDIISFRNSYHGLSSSCMDLTGFSVWKHNVGTTQGIHHAMNPDVYRGLWGGSQCRDSPVQTTRLCVCEQSKCNAGEMYYQQLEEIFKYSIPTGKLAALFAESIQGVGGTVQFPKGFLKKAYELVRANGGICIADEVQTGFGRTGEHYWGFEMHGVIPDIVTMAKGIGNGFPLAAVVTTPEIAESLTHALHFNTFGGNPLACTIGLTVLKIIEEEKLQQNSHIVGTYFLKKLATLRDEFECIGDVRGKGLMIGVEMVTDKETKNALPAMQSASIREECKNLGVLLGSGGLYGNVDNRVSIVLRIKPPMCITKDDVDFAVEVLKIALQKHSGKQSKAAKL